MNFVSFTAKLALVFGLPALLLAVSCHVVLPRQTVTVLVTLILIGVAITVWVWLDAAERQGTGMEILGVPPMLLVFTVGNLLAIPIARWIRSQFNARSER
jgi:hypothetical protein